MLVISIDGACRRNGKPDCVGAGSAFILHFDDDLKVTKTQTISDYETGSTNQRGELLALRIALEFIIEERDNANIITDSEYMFNAMTKEWFRTWEHNGWLTSAGESVKNKDLWVEISELYRRASRISEISFYHIKGHCIPFGAVTAATLLSRDTSGIDLFAAALIKYDTCITGDPGKVSKIEYAKELSLRNNGFVFDDDSLRMFIAANVVADAVATKCVTAADALLSK